jgi:putative phosphoesterase
VKLAIISDIHANFYYLESVMFAIDSFKVDEIYCLGDMVGYYDQPEKVIQFIIKHNIKAVKGNHEHYLLGLIHYNKEKESLYNIQYHKNQLSDNCLEYIKQLPISIERVYCDKKICFSHSTPNGCEQYFYHAIDLDKDILKKYDYYFLGHTHIPLVTNHYGCFVINPGSVGQPRDRTGKPSFVVVDIKNDSIFLSKIEVDNLYYMDRLRKSGFNEKVINILGDKQ